MTTDWFMHTCMHKFRPRVQRADKPRLSQWRGHTPSWSPARYASHGHRLGRRWKWNGNHVTLPI